ncbi:MAG: hypothetical protein ABR921_19810 [Candidatus Sulfotelmatobacter sp.]|jgi:hypothetical protein
MYTGTLISDLMAVVERAEQLGRQRVMAEEMELERMFDLQVPAAQSEQIFAGAA